MTTLREILDEQEKLEKAATQIFYRIHYPPEDYDGDEWSLGRSTPCEEFASKADALVFAESKRNKRVPDWGQPHMVEFKKSENKTALEDYLSNHAPQIRAEVKKLVEALEYYADPDKWDSTTHESTRDGKGCADFETVKLGIGLGYAQVAGKKARSVLASLGFAKGEE